MPRQAACCQSVPYRNTACFPCRSDNDINSRTVIVLEEGGRETPVSWRDLAVGDIVKVRQLGAGG